MIFLSKVYLHYLSTGMKPAKGDPFVVTFESSYKIRTSSNSKFNLFPNISWLSALPIFNMFSANKQSRKAEVKL